VDCGLQWGLNRNRNRLLGDKVYVATTVGNECILGASVAKDAGEKALQDAYQVFKDEAQCINLTAWQERSRSFLWRKKGLRGFLRENR
jgi:hypothetical protein